MKNKSYSPRPFYLRPVPIVLTVALLVFAVWFVYGENGIHQRSKLTDQWVDQNGKIQFLKDQKKELEHTLAALREKDEKALEAAARDYGLVAPDEKIYEIKLATADTTK